MKKIFLFGAFALLSTTLFSCSADEFETTAKTTELKKEIAKPDAMLATGEEGPDDDPVNIKPPKKK